MLTNAFIKHVQRAATPQKFADGGGLFLYVSPGGSKLWRLAYRYNRKSKLISFGAYPAVSLKMARERRDAAKRLLAEGVDPGIRRKTDKAARRGAEEYLFRNIALEWHQNQTGHLTSESYRRRLLRRLELHLFPHLGKVPIGMIEARDLLAAVRPVEQKKNYCLARKLVEMCGRIFRYAVATGRARHNIAADLRGALATYRVQHRAAIKDPRTIGRLLLDIDAYTGSFQIQCAMKLLPLVFLRSGEIRNAVWQEIDFEKMEWRIPSERMKMQEMHIVPLAKQAVAIIRALYAFSGNARYMFPSIRSFSRPIGHSSLLNALRLMGYAKEEQSTHGFRSIASTLLNELGYNSDWIERQLAHADRNGIRAAYNYAQYLPERRKMMQDWADHLDQLKHAALLIFPAPPCRLSPPFHVP